MKWHENHNVTQTMEVKYVVMADLVNDAARRI